MLIIKRCHILSVTKYRKLMISRFIIPSPHTSIVKDDANIGVWESKAGITCLNGNGSSENIVFTETNYEQRPSIICC